MAAIGSDGSARIRPKTVRALGQCPWDRVRRRGVGIPSTTLTQLPLETATAAAEPLHPAVAGPTSASTASTISFGYPASLDLGGPRQLFAMLEPADIGAHHFGA